MSPTERHEQILKWADTQLENVIQRLQDQQKQIKLGAKSVYLPYEQWAILTQLSGQLEEARYNMERGQ